MNQIDRFQCDEDLLERLLRDELSVAQVQDVEIHLNECDSCASQLQTIASNKWSWDEVVDCLPPDEFDSQQDAETLTILGYATPNDGGAVDQSMISREISGWLDATDDPNMLGRFAGYEIVGIIGHGGMGIVLKGFEASLNRFVAIKVLAPRLATNGAARQRFSREAQAAAAVRHDNVIAVHRVDQWHGLPFLVMPYVAGVSLQRRIDTEGPLSTEATLRIASQVAAGLAAAHAQGLVHRDIKPANILLEKGVERVTITDFGLARAVDDASITRTGVIAGTPQYMSPEQAQAKALDHRSDLFSLGSVMYAMATGRPPFRGDGNAEVLQKIIDQPARQVREIEPSIPEWLVEIIDWLHAKPQDNRPQTADEIAELLESWLAHLQQPETVPKPERIVLAQDAISKPPSRWQRNLVFVASGMFAVLAAVIIYLETSKGTIRFESEVDNVPIRIMQAGEVVDAFTVSKERDYVRIGAGEYVVQLDIETDEISIKDGEVSLRRWGREVVRIVKLDDRIATGDAVDHGHDIKRDSQSVHEAFLAEVESRSGKEYSMAERKAWWQHWLTRLLDTREQTENPDLRRSIAISSVGMANALLDFDTSEELLRELVKLSRTEDTAARWHAELDGIPEQKRLYKIDENAQPSDHEHIENEKHNGASSSQRDFAYITRRVMDYSMTTNEKHFKAFRPHDKPLLRWSNPQRATKEGATYLWTHQGRPAAIMSPYLAWDNKSYNHEFQSLHSESFLVRFDSEIVWAPQQAGLTLTPDPGARSVSPDRSVRLAQMKSIAQSFTATGGAVESPRWGLSLSADPMFRYEDFIEAENVIDGALFAFTMDSDPEVLMLIEARQSDGDEPTWYVGFARMAVAAMFVEYQGEVVWEIGRGTPWDSNSTYFSIEKPFSPPSAFFQLVINLPPATTVAQLKSELPDVTLQRFGRIDDAGTVTSIIFCRVADESYCFYAVSGQLRSLYQIQRLGSPYEPKTRHGKGFVVDSKRPTDSDFFVVADLHEVLDGKHDKQKHSHGDSSEPCDIEDLPVTLIHDWLQVPQPSNGH